MADLENLLSITDDWLNSGGSMQVQKQHGRAAESSRSSSEDPFAQNDTAILALAGIYTILLILLFTLPRVLAGDWFDAIIRTWIAILVVGGGAVITAITTLFVAWCRWSRLSRTMRILAMYPVGCSLLIFAIVCILAHLANRP
jgi:hypothetical protein